MYGVILTCVIYPLCGIFAFGVFCGIAVRMQEKEEKEKQKKMKIYKTGIIYRYHH